jgi:hypothetical protein
MSWEAYLKASKRFAEIASNRDEDPTVRVQNAFKAVEFAIAACATKYRKNRPERGKELLFVEINFGAKARDSFKAIMTAYYDFLWNCFETESRIRVQQNAYTTRDNIRRY